MSHRNEAARPELRLVAEPHVPEVARDQLEPLAVNDAKRAVELVPQQRDLDADAALRAGNLSGYADLQGQIKTLVDQLSALVPN